MSKKPRNSNKSCTFGEAVRALREEQGLTQSALAEQVRDSADAPWISRVESNGKKISLETAILIAQALGVNLSLGDYHLRPADDL